MKVYRMFDAIWGDFVLIHRFHFYIHFFLKMNRKPTKIQNLQKLKFLRLNFEFQSHLFVQSDLMVIMNESLLAPKKKKKSRWGELVFCFVVLFV